jgi:hypothetical protein
MAPGVGSFTDEPVVPEEQLRASERCFPWVTNGVTEAVTRSAGKRRTPLRDTRHSTQRSEAMHSKEGLTAGVEKCLTGDADGLIVAVTHLEASKVSYSAPDRARRFERGRIDCPDCAF